MRYCPACNADLWIRSCGHFPIEEEKARVQFASSEENREIPIFQPKIMNNEKSPLEQAQEDIKLAREISSKMKPSARWEKLGLLGPHVGIESEIGLKILAYENSIYQVTLRQYDKGWPLGGGKWAKLGISSKDGAPRHDWRDFQKIKNDTVGTNWEAIELYPDEGRLLDPSNYYILYCAPRIPVGEFGRRVIANETNCIAPQRPFAI